MKKWTEQDQKVPKKGSIWQKFPTIFKYGSEPPPPWLHNTLQYLIYKGSKLCVSFGISDLH